MPAILTHDFFGRDAYPDVADRLDLVSLAQHDAFMLGNQGPDPLFYLVADPRVPVSNRIGSLMHHARPARLLTSLHDALSMLSRQELSIGRAYAAGFVGHYLLDGSIHPLVFSQQYAICEAGVEGLDDSHGSLVHAEIERDLDEMMLYQKTGRTVLGYRPYREVLQADGEVLAVIDKLYFYMALWAYSRTIELDCYTRAVKAFRAIQRLFYSPRRGKARILVPLERRFSSKDYSIYQAMSHRVRAEAASEFANDEHTVWQNPFTNEETSASFHDLYASALDRMPSAVEAVLDRDFDDDASEKLCGLINFDGKPADRFDIE